ncbi:hypothetical protein LUX05_16085 [Streptomyces somaliensis]|nr:hypothetical protein [Streptomyces somaliensis]
MRPLSHRIGFLFDLAGRRLAAAGTGHPVGPAVLGRSRAAALELAADGPVGLVHGDLHPANVLSGPGARLVAIDPRPAWGDPDFDAVDWVLGGATGPAVLEERIGELASLVPGQSPDRVRGWCRALAVLNALPRDPRAAGRRGDPFPPLPRGRLNPPANRGARRRRRPRPEDGRQATDGRRQAAEAKADGRSGARTPPASRARNRRTQAA